jgi:hypothetical protein
MSSILVSMFLSDLSLLSTLELSITATEELRVKLESKLEPDLVSSRVLIVSESELEPIEISIRALRIVLIFSLIY